MANVVLMKTKDYSEEGIGETVARALERLDYDLNSKIGLVVIKPNLCYYWDYSTGETTDPRVVSAIIDWVRQRIGNDVRILITEADASAMRTKYVFRMLGYERLSRDRNVKLVNLSEGEISDGEVVVAGERFLLPVNKILLDADLIVNVPKMKSHRVVGFTCALKNMFGAIAKPGKYVYHRKLARVIVGINKIVTTNIVLADGVIVGGEVPKKIGAIIAGDDALATDIVVAKAMSYKPSRIGYLKLAISEKIGDANSIKIIENPAKLEDIKKEFAGQNHQLKKLSWGLQLRLLKLYMKMSHDVLPPILSE